MTGVDDGLIAIAGILLGGIITMIGQWLRDKRADRRQLEEQASGTVVAELETSTELDKARIEAELHTSDKLWERVDKLEKRLDDEHQRCKEEIQRVVEKSQQECDEKMEREIAAVENRMRDKFKQGLLEVSEPQ